MHPGKQDTSVQCWASGIDGGPTLNQCWVNVSLLAGLVIRNFIQCIDPVNKKHIKYWFNIGTASQTMAQQ